MTDKLKSIWNNQQLCNKIAFCFGIIFLFVSAIAFAFGSNINNIYTQISTIRFILLLYIIHATFIWRRDALDKQEYEKILSEVRRNKENKIT